MYCKTIILSNSTNISNSPKGILTLSNSNSSTIGKIRLYNIANLPQGTKIGLYVGENVHICLLNKKPQHYEFKLDSQIDLNQAIYCAIIDNSKGDKTVLLEGGSFNGFYFSDSPMDAVLEAKDNDLENIINQAMLEAKDCEKHPNCTNCEYKKYFYDNHASQNIENCESGEMILEENISREVPPSSLIEQQSTDVLDNNLNNQTVQQNYEDFSKVEQTKDLSSSQTNNTNSLSKDKINSNQLEHKDKMDNLSSKEKDLIEESTKNLAEQENFLNEIVEQIDEMFKLYPEDNLLNSIIPDSRFIKVDNNDQSYVLGIIYEDKMMKYIAYGVPAKYNSLPPADLGKNYQWLALNPNDVMSDGYFMIYQNALNGKIVELTIE